VKRLEQFAAWITGGSWRVFLHRLGIAIVAITGILEAMHIIAPEFAPLTAALGVASRLDRARRALPLFPPAVEPEPEPITAVEKMP
jgi:hypothetical protein